MNTFLNVLLSLTLSASAGPVKLSPLEQAQKYEWEPTASSLVIIDRLGEDGKAYRVLYSSKLVPCHKKTKDDKAPYINLRVETGSETPDACYRVFKGPIGYLEGETLISLTEKTWPPK